MTMSPIDYEPQPHGRPPHPRRTTQQPEQRPSKYDSTEVEISHPAFAVLQLNRSSWSPPGTVLTGSALHHASTISITLSRAVGSRGHGDERFRDHGRAIVQVEMSEAQWARFIASSGIGSGVPCTLRAAPDPDAEVDHFIPYIGVPDTPHRKANDEARARASAAVEKSSQARAMLAEALAKPSMTKADIRAAIARLDRGIEHFLANEAFHLRQFQEVTDHVVADAKSEVEAFVNRVAANTGLLALKDGAAPVLMLPETHREQGD